MHTPTATYRLQFSPEFRFSEAKELLSYLSDLGISDIYASPIFQARKGSTHGYDIVDHNAVNSELGSMEEFESLLQYAGLRGLAWLQDIVPNHMAYHSDNRMIRKILEEGPSSPFAEYFDINWEHPSENLQGRILAPFLGKFYSECLEDGELRIGFDREGLYLCYHDLRLPLLIDSYIDILAFKIEQLEEELGANDPEYIKYIGTIHSLAQKPLAEDMTPESGNVDYIKFLLWNLYEDTSAIRGFIDKNIETFNGTPGKPESFDLLDLLLSKQVFRLSFCKLANEDINYRRFFTINDLISLRVDREKVFENVHKLVFRLIDKGLISGLRIDHIDGLMNPSVYLERLRDKEKELFIVVEKILAFEEDLPHYWPIQGTTGYDFLNAVNGVFIATENTEDFDKIYKQRRRNPASFEEMVIEKKRLISGRYLTGDIDSLACTLKSISSQDRYGRDVTPYGLKRALVEVMGRFSVYRTYVEETRSRPSDRSFIEDAIAKAREENPNLYYELKLIGKFMALAFDAEAEAKGRQQALDLVMRFQQITGPLMAKGLEDTFFYCYNRLLSLNEVGGHPDRFGTTIEEFHHFNRERLRSCPASLSATATHDTKRGEDARARLNVLSEIPSEWASEIEKWEGINKAAKKTVHGKPVPDRNDEYFFYQTLLASYPAEQQDLKEYQARIQEYLLKAVREAKVFTGWLTPDTAYEEAFTEFAETLLSDSPKSKFLPAFLPFQQKIAHFGYLNSLSQTLLKIAAPGTPDFYQGTELWDLSLVDPDNRRPVDFQKRRALLTDLAKTPANPGAFFQDLLTHMEDGRIKLFLTHKALQARKQTPGPFHHGAYIPLQAQGVHRNQVIAFARSFQQAYIVAIAPRFYTNLVTSPPELPLGEKIWGDTTVSLPEKAPHIWENALTGQKFECEKTFSIGNILHLLPVALLIGREK